MKSIGGLRRVLLSAFVVVMSATSIYAQAIDYLLILDPRQAWTRATGRIEETTLAIRPRGLYMEYGLFLTISPRGTAMANAAYTNLEVVLNFGLPPNAIVTDSWLWVGDSIMQAEIKDYWSASSIYEAIVGMRRDPSIFTKFNDRYELRVYPIAGNGLRKIKITYLVPINWSGNRITAPLPLNILKTSVAMPPIKVMFWGNERWGDPRIDELPNVNFTISKEPSSEDYATASISTLSAVPSTLTFSTSTPLRDGAYVNIYHNGKEGFFQMAFRPMDVLQGNVPPRKYCIVIDYDPAKSRSTLAQALSVLQSSLLEKASPLDSFTVMYSRFTVERVSLRWLPMERATMERVFTTLATMSLYSNLPTLLVESAKFSSANDGTTLVLANTDRFVAGADANQLIRDIQSTVTKIPPITILDYCDQSQATTINGRSYYGNGYLYANLAQLSGGASYTARDYSSGLLGVFPQAIQSLRGINTAALDMFSTMQGGFCYSRYSVVPTAQASVSSAGRSAPSGITDVQQTFLQTGKFAGTLPLTLNIAGLMSSLPIARTLSFTSANVEIGTGVSEQIWVGNYMSGLLPTAGTPSNAVVNELISKSLAYRVLSNYTAFLALEPNDTLRPCQTCSITSDNQRGGSSSAIALSTKAENLSSGIGCTISPNPFSTETFIELTFQESLQPERSYLSICNVLGQEIYQIRLESYAGEKKIRLRWSGQDSSGSNVAQGMYFLILRTPSGRSVWKLLKT